MQIIGNIKQTNLRHVAHQVRELEASGYDGVVTTEVNHDPFMPLGVAATLSDTLSLNTGIIIAFARSPMVTAMSCWDLQIASGGRFTLGLGSQVKGHNERRFSVPWSAPAPRMKEYVQSLRAIWKCWAEGGKELAYLGKHYSFTLMTPNFTPEPSEHPYTPVTVAAVGPGMMRVAGEVCDGVRLHAFCTRKYLENVVAKELQTGFDRGGRTRENFQISGGGFIATGKTDEEVDLMWEWVRSRVAFYGSTRTYWPVLEQHDLLDLGEELHRMSVAQRWEEMTPLIKDDVVELFCARGRHSEIAGAIEERFGGFSDVITMQARTNEEPDILEADLVQDLQRIKTPFQGFQLG